MTRNSAIMNSSKAKHCQPLPWSINDVSHALNLSRESVLLNLEGLSNHDHPCFSGVSTDSRSMGKDELFVALKGESFDGHAFLPHLLQKGVKGFVVDRALFSDLPQKEKQKILYGKAVLFLVNNTLEALGQLARYQRLRAGVKVVAITGSNGKTTTRKMMASIFEQQFNTLSTTGNFNNEIGLPLTLLQLSGEHEWAVVEMGMNHPGEISRLSRIALPDIAVITNTAQAHLEGMGSVNNVAKAKAEIIEGMNPGSAMIINNDDPRREILLQRASQNSHIEKLLFFGTHHKETTLPSPAVEAGETRPPSKVMEPHNKLHFVTAENIEFGKTDTQFTLSTTATSESPGKFYINSPAPFMIHNALAACAAGFAADISIEKIEKGISLFKPVSGRMNIIQRGNIHVIDDTYNANPASVKGALATLRQLNQGGVAIAVLGDMLELGDKSRELHFSVGERAVHAGISRLYAFGKMSTEVVQGAVQAGFSREMTLHGTKDEIIAHLTRYIENHSSTQIYLLVKGSRGMRMEDIVQKVIN